MKPYRDNVRKAVTLDLNAYRTHGYVQQDKITYGVDWLKVCTYSLAVAVSLSIWISLFLLALWWRG